uniref:HIT domain-containing protein n=1 Tax=Neobodo designis TaxID=312471 RepID=A0A7S1M4Y5_NEODS|mmetsp:Transcript_34040/g.105113  ORF Transcript_34040/g.105113 Transcript_34040/m.105113 type:complete len:389 (+) Transcript_34040:35-1201(+)
MRSFFIGAVAASKPPCVDAIAGAKAPKHAVEAEEFLAKAIAAAGDDAATAAKLQRILRNKVKKCPACGKPNGFTLAACNACGGPLGNVAVSHSTNVFMCFVLGIARGPFPMTISIRKQTDTTLVLDDLLALSPLHFNAIPTDAHIPDWRYLLRRPAQGLALIRKLQSELHATANEQFMSNEAWRNACIAGGAPLPADAYVSGFNFPPSQYQLHIQFMAPMLVPHHRYQYLRGTHYTEGRFFPYAYVDAVLDAAVGKFGADGAGIPAELLQEDTPVEAIVAFAESALGQSYAEAHKRAYDRAGALYAQYATWKPDQFRGVAAENGETGKLEVTLNHGGSERITDAAQVNAMINEDKLALQNYGRPYDDAGKPTGTYYSFPRDAADVELW